MTYRSLLLMLSVAGILALAGCDRAKVSDASRETPEDFTVEISGTEGLVVDLLVVMKPDTNTIEKAVDEEVTIPYKQEFRGVRHAVWVDGTYKGLEGEYTLKIGGSSASGIVKRGAEAQSCLYNI